MLLDLHLELVQTSLDLAESHEPPESLRDRFCAMCFAVAAVFIVMVVSVILQSEIERGRREKSRAGQQGKTTTLATE